MADSLSERYRHLLTGVYDCVDRIVLNAYFSMAQDGGGFRVWWRQLYNGSEDELDNVHLMRLAGPFARRLRSWAKANGIPLIDCQRGERKRATRCVRCRPSPSRPRASPPPTKR